MDGMLRKKQEEGIYRSPTRRGEHHEADDHFDAPMRVPTQARETIIKNIGKVKKSEKKKLDLKGVVHFGNEKFNLVVHMMLGIRQSVRRVNHE